MTHFLDTNVLIRYLTNDDPAKAQRAFTLLERLAEGAEEAVTTPLVIFETVFLLERTYRLPKETVREQVRDVLALQGLQLAEKTLCLRARDVYVEQNISYADAYNAAWMLGEGITGVYSWDREFDRVSGLTRHEP